MTEESFRIVTAPPQKPDYLAGVLSYLIPGLGQIKQGRTTKGYIFFVSLYGLFVYGMWLGQWQNVFITQKDSKAEAPVNRTAAAKLGASLLSRPHYGGQFFIGIAAWPAIYQYVYYDDSKDADPLFGKWQREPSDEKLNEMQRNDNKTWDLAWVYTVIAGVLNILVIYDAVAGAAFTVVPFKKSEGASQDDAKAMNPPAPASTGGGTIEPKTVEIRRESKTIEIRREGSK